MSKTIRRLEQRLGVRPFHRATRKSSLTVEGERLLAEVKPKVEGLVNALRRGRSAVDEDEAGPRPCSAGPIAALTAPQDATTYRVSMVSGDTRAVQTSGLGWQYAGFRMVILSNSEAAQGRDRVLRRRCPAQRERHGRAR